MIDLVKPYVNAGIAVLLLAAGGYVWWIHYDRNSIRAEFADYKEEINDQVKKNKAEAARQKERQAEEYKSAQTSYEVTRGKLAAALERLRNLEGMPRGGPVPVADSGGVAVPAPPEDPTRIDAAATLGTGIEQTPFYSDAMMDTLQCRDLMRFVKTLHCVAP